jgi:hypothetical protein
MTSISEHAQESMSQQNYLLSAESGLRFIEQLQISSSKPCTKDNTPYLIGVNQNAKICLLTKASCQCWDCEPCAARNARKWIARIIMGCNQQDCQWSFLTITAHEKFRLSKSVANIRQGWKKIYNRILAKMGKTARSLLYAKIWEQHKNGSFHIHILLNVCLGTRWAKNNARECGLGFQAEWHEVGNVGMAAGYIAKYSLKNASIQRGMVGWPRGLRRIEVSRNWPKLPDLEQLHAFYWSQSTSREFQSEMAGKYQVQGFDVIDLV